MSSVWVCGCRKAFFTADDITACEQNIEGQCSFVLKPCDAVEYAPVKKPCVWKQTPDGQYETGCGNMFEFTTDGPKENGFNHCPYCGAKMDRR